MNNSLLPNDILHKMVTREQVDELITHRAKLVTYGTNWHTGTCPMLSDSEWDLLKGSVIDLENEILLQIDPQTPSRNPDASKGLVDFEARAMTIVELSDEKAKGDFRAGCIPIGIHVHVRYQEGEIMSAFLSGDGSKGFDVTHQLKDSGIIPLFLIDDRIKNSDVTYCLTVKKHRIKDAVYDSAYTPPEIWIPRFVSLAVFKAKEAIKRNVAAVPIACKNVEGKNMTPFLVQYMNTKGNATIVGFSQGYADEVITKMRGSYFIEYITTHTMDKVLVRG